MRKKNMSKRLGPISTDAALLTSTVFSFVLSLTNPDSQVYQAIPYIMHTKHTTDSLQNAMNPPFEKELALSCDRAAEVLAKVLFLEKIYRRLNLNDPKHIVAILYTLVRLIEKDKAFEKFKEEAINQVGRYWRWPLVWEIAMEFETVKRRWDDEAAKGTMYLLDWQDECKKFTYNYWSSKQEQYKNIKKQKKKLISSLRHTLGLTKKKQQKTDL